MRIDDNELVARVQSGEGEVFGELYDRYIRKIYDFVYFKTYHKETAEDLTSLVFAKALRSIGSYRTANGQFAAWLYRIARNTIIDHYRTHKPEVNIDDVWDLADTHDTITEVDVKRELEEVRQHMQKLTAAQRDIVMMRVWQELSYAEIAVITGKSEASCKMAFSRAVVTLRRHVSITTLLVLLIALLTR